MNPPLDEARAWALLLTLARRAGAGRAVAGEVGLALDERGALVEGRDGAWIVARPEAPRGWAWPTPAAAGATPALTQLLDLYAPLCLGAASEALVVGHLAQSLDGRIATHSGASQFITSDENLVHCHRMRALFDVVLVGSRTVRADDPQLTTRRVSGPNPVRAVVDPARRLGAQHRVFQDGHSRTLLFCGAAPGAAAPSGRAEIVAVDARDGLLAAGDLLAALAARGLRRVFVEGGGITVSRFLEAGALQRLHMAVAPLVLGSGRPTLTLPVIDDLAQALPLGCRHFAMGRDMLFDCVPRRAP